MSKRKSGITSGLALCLAVIAAGSACSTAKVRVMPGEDGINRVVVRDIERDDAEQKATEVAEDYCKERNLMPVYVLDSTQYTGSMDESTRKTVRNASKAAMIIGGPGSINRGTRPYGEVLGSAGVVGYSMTSDRDYQSEVRFRCK